VIRPITEDDLPEIFEWFAERKWPMPAIKDIAPQTGLLSEINGVPRACLWFYLTGKSIAFIEWIATNPEIEQKVQSAGLIEILSHMQATDDSPVKALCFYTKNEKLSRLFTRAGFSHQASYHKLLWTKS